MTLHCLACGSANVALGRPRKDGSRWPMRYCGPCLAGPHRKALPGGGRYARNRAARSYRRRQAVHERVMLGPCPCRDCGTPDLMYLAGTAAIGRWVEPDGRRHWCGSLAS